MDSDIIDQLIVNDTIHLIYYLDHAVSNENLSEIKRKPFILWTVGKILNENSNDPYYFLISSGRLYRKNTPSTYEIVVKKAILKLIPIYKIPMNFDANFFS